MNRLAESCRDRLRKGSAVLVDGELQSRSWKSEDGHNRSIVEIKARRIQFLNKRLVGTDENGSIDDEEPSVAVDDSIDYTEDSFDKFLSEEESSLIKQSGNGNEERS